MNERNEPMLFSQFRLVEFRWNLPQRVLIPFGGGLTILHGRTQAERTAILRLIRYAWGSSSNRIGNEILQAAKNVELEFVANGELISVDRSCETPTGRFSVYDSLNGYQFEKSEMSGFLLDKLKLPQVF